jgi:CRP-like cAMP-binding protein
LPPKFTNLILGAMPEETRARLAPRLEPVDLPVMRVLCEAGSSIEHIYFPRTCVLSLLAVAQTGEAVETATIGREGAFGLVVGMHSREAFVRCVVQFAGSADRISALDFKKEFDRSPQARRVVMYYIEALLIQYQQSVLCGTLHTVEERLARWLLVMHDGANSNALLLMQDFLAEILGVARTTVTSAARKLRSKNLISYRRGRISVRNRSGLERASCECYRVLRDHFERLLPPA